VPLALLFRCTVILILRTDVRLGRFQLVSRLLSSA
jgi:hypothetical protein